MYFQKRSSSPLKKLDNALTVIAASGHASTIAVLYSVASLELVTVQNQSISVSVLLYIRVADVDFMAQVSDLHLPLDPYLFDKASLLLCQYNAQEEEERLISRSSTHFLLRFSFLFFFFFLEENL